MKKYLIFGIIFFLGVSIFAQDADYRNWKKQEEEMFWLARKCIEVANSSEWKEKGGSKVEASSKDGTVNCEYDILKKTGVVYYGEPSISYSIESGFFADLYNIMGSSSVSTSGTDVYNTWRGVPRWFYAAQRILLTGKTIIVLYFSTENINKYGYK